MDPLKHLGLRRELAVDLSDLVSEELHPAGHPTGGLADEVKVRDRQGELGDEPVDVAGGDEDPPTDHHEGTNDEIGGPGDDLEDSSEDGQRQLDRGEDYLEGVLQTLGHSASHFEVRSERLEGQAGRRQIVAVHRCEDLAEGCADGLEDRTQGLEDVDEALDGGLSASGVDPHRQSVVETLRHGPDAVADLVVDAGEQGGGLIEVADDDLEGRGPHGSDGFLGGADQRRGRSDHRGRVLRGLLLLDELVDLLVRQTDALHLGAIGLLVLVRHDAEVGGHDVCRQPPLLKGAVEVRLDLGGADAGLVEGAHGARDLDQAALHVLVAHVGVCQRPPVHQADGARAHGLRKLVRRACGLLGIGSGGGCLIREALDDRRGLIDLHPRVGEQGSVGRHVRERVDGLVGVGVELIQGLVDRLQGLLGVGHDGLDRAHLVLVFLEAIGHRRDGERLRESETSIDGTVGDVRQGRDADDAHLREMLGDLVDAGSDAAEVDVLGRGIDVVEGLARLLELERFLQLAKGAKGLGDPGLELAVVELHRHNALFDLSHSSPP